jgi:peptidoglycan/LPS O-acetylase OafA/YrhL
VKREIQSLTALRGIGALLVLCHHVFVAGPLTRGYLGVDLFFMLSGFVLLYCYESQFRGQVRWSNYKSFLVARLSRIYPLHLLTIVLLLPFFGAGPQFSAAALVQNLFLTQGPWYGPCVSWNFAAWSLSVEWHAYLIFPFAAMLMLRRNDRTLRLIAIACLSIIEGLQFYLGTIGIVASPLVLVRGLPEFALGMVIYLFYRDDNIRARFAGDLPCIGILVGFVVAGAFSENDSPFLLLIPGLLMTCAANRGRIAAILASHPLRYLGQISFSLYMIQLVIRTYLYAYGPFPPGSWEQRATLFVLSIALAIPMSRFFEYPSRDWLRALGRRWTWNPAPIYRT